MTSVEVHNMEVERAGPVSQARRNMVTLAKQITPLHTKKTVSVASIFKQQPREMKQVNVTPQANLNVPRLTVEDTSVMKSISVKSRSSSHSPQKAGGRVAKKRSDMHPLAVAFRDTSDDYRRHLYKTTTLKINKTLEALLNSLHESTLQTVSPDNSQQDPGASPLRLSAPAKYERMALKLYQPLSKYQLTLWATNKQGEKERFNSTLEARMEHYDEHIAERTKEVAQLQKDWEMIVGEIWKLGVSCVGESVMEDLLFINQGTAGPSSSPSKATETESTLFVLEQGSSPPRKTRASKKRVTFEAPDARDNDNVPSTLKFPEFLYQPSRFREHTLPIVPSLLEREIKELERNVKKLGRAQVEELRKIEKDHQEYWKRKNAQLASALQED